MRRISRFTAGPLLVLAVLAGCRGDVVSPPTSPTLAAPVAGPAPMSLAPQGRPRLALSGGLPDSASVDFYVGPNGGVFYTGDHAVVFPAGSVCDPATSSYGPGTWDDPCSPLQSSLRVHAEVRRHDGTTSVDFTPALRFVPSTSSSKWVWIVMFTPDAKDATGDLSRFNILYAPTLGSTPIDETASDASLRTYVDTWMGISMRRIKHFSAYEQGYGMGSGRTCEGECPE
ncbi:MAG: hypothetical protein ACJ79A_20210 [Gemmatimonadaceae bacterium]